MNYRKLNTYWPKIGGILGVILLVVIFLINRNNELDIFVLIFWTHLAFLMFHEFEEYVFPGGFKEFFNTQTVFALDPPEENVPLNELMIFYINIGAWGLFLLGSILAVAAPWIGVMMIFFNIVNVFGHVGLFQIKKPGYNPGLLTSLIFLVPIIVFTFIQLNGSDLLSNNEMILAIVGGVLLAAALPISGNIQKQKANRNHS